MLEARYQLRLDPQTRAALRLLAQAEDRPMSAMIRVLIRQAAAAKGLWIPEQGSARPSLVRHPSAKTTEG